ncbi:hypothetical protein LTR72_011569 [Exophiala xenobiotica]|nr:hypothetical protein LTR72_011569 [Exophiala xenobiotica]KAK5470303.1 hypothetical protein LTR55_011033 [Exophiala xenobiotica]KAK5550497.1 hypothetical protein LTR46_011493 [Exophiala xenobiotica]
MSTSRVSTNGHGPDVALECVAGEYAKSLSHKLEVAAGLETDTSEIVNEMIESTNHFNIGSLMNRSIRFIGNGQAPVHLYWEKLLMMIQSGQIDPLRMVSHRVRIEDLEKVYYKFDKREPGIQKVFVQTRFSSPPSPGNPELTVF